MDSQELEQPQNHQVVMNRFVAACQADERVLPAFLHGSYVKGTVDAYCDLDLGLITTDEAYVDFNAGREAFIRLLGEPVFLEDFGATLTCYSLRHGANYLQRPLPPWVEPKHRGRPTNRTQQPTITPAA
jgi:hypothetical protein